MSSPMTGLPEHLSVRVTEDGRHPAAGEAFDHYVCWCGDEDCEVL